MTPHKALEDRPADWLWLCDHFETEEFQGCGDIPLYKACYSNDKGWASVDARENHELMVRMQEELTQQDEIPLTYQQICEKVLGKAYGHIRGRLALGGSLKDTG
uniref:Uncharacterized protein n=1 Tax=Oryza brachyantha TaxID=4533 RepID=J3N127_ORYBR